MSNIEKIRQEIERLKNIAENDNASEYLRGQARVCSVLLAFIDSLPEEKQSYVTDSPGDPGNPGEPGISDLEEEIQKAIDKYPLNKEDMSEDDIATYHQGLIFGARHFAEWGAKHLK